MKRFLAPAVVSLSLVALGIGAGCADAADWQWDPRVVLSGNYDDNYGLDSGQAQGVSVAGSAVDASLHAFLLDPTNRFDITPRVRYVNYPGDAQFNAVDEFVDSQFLQTWQRANLNVYGSYWRQDVLRSYLPTSEISTPLGQNSTGADLGNVSEKIRQDLGLLAPTATFDLTPREHLVIQAQYLNVGYSKDILNEVQNFQTIGGSVGLGYSISAQSTLTVRGTDTQLKPASTPGQNSAGANTYGIEGAWDSHLSEVMHAYAKLGIEHTVFDAVTEPGTDITTTHAAANSVSGGVGISRKFVNYDLFADFSRNVNANSAGAVVARDDLRVRLEHKFNARYSGYVGLRGINQTALDNAVGFTGQRYGQAAMGVEWRIYRQFSIISEYAYTTLKDQNVPKAAGSNAVTISLRYEPHRPAEEFGVSVGR